MSLLRLIILSALLFVCSKSSAIIVNGLDYSFNGTEAYVVGYDPEATNILENLVIPETVEYKGLTFQVKHVEGFDYCGVIKTLTIPKTISVVNGFYNCTHLESVTFLGDADIMDFGKCVDLKTVKVYGTAYIYEYAFQYCTNLKSVDFGGTDEIEEYAFAGCRNLEWICFGETLTKIGNHAFADCTSLTYLLIPFLDAKHRIEQPQISQTAFERCNLIQSVLYLDVSFPTYNVSKIDLPNLPKANHYFLGSDYSYIIYDKTFIYDGTTKYTSFTTTLPAGFKIINTPIIELGKNAISSGKNVTLTFSNSNMSFSIDFWCDYCIEKVTLKGYVSDANRLYGEINPSFNISYLGFIEGEDESIIVTKPKLVTEAVENSPVGTYKIEVLNWNVDNYELEYAPGTLTIIPAPLSIKVADAERFYGYASPAFQLFYSGLKNDEIAPEWTEEPIFTSEATASSSVGKYMINVTCKPKNYEATIESGTLSVTPAPLTIKADDATRLYCEEAPAYTFSCKGFVNNETSDVLTKQPVMETDATPASNVGVYTITPHGAEAENYAIDYETGKLTISQRPLIVKAASVTRSYGEDNPEFALTYEGFVNGETERVLNPIPIAKSTATAKSNVGVYDITVDGGRAFNYALKYESGTLTVTPKALCVAAGDYERAYNEENPEFRLTYSGFAADDSEASLVSCPTAKTQATKTSNVGTYPVEVSGGYSPNYTFEYIPGTLTINKAEQTLEWEQDLSQLRVNDQVELQAHASSGLPVTYQMEHNDFVELYPAGSRSYLECRTPGSFWIKAVQNGNDNYYPSQRISKEVNIIGTKKDSLLLTIRQTDNGTVSTWVAKNSSWQFKIAATDGWIIHSVTFNDVDVTDQLDNEGIFAAPAITSNSILSVVYEKEVDELVRTAKTSRIKVQSTTFGARVTGTDVGDIIQVFSVDGVQHRTVQAKGTMTDVVLESGNVYILKVGDNTVKFSY